MRPQASNPLLLFSDEVRDALACAGPVVALETNVLAHGLRHPDNIATTLRVEQAIRDNGATPATIAIDRGRILVGLSEDQIHRFGSSADIPKVSSRDMGVALARGHMGATTVASSIVAADLAGIAFFASAGIGGVHRGAERTMDVSSDLIQFTRSRVAVVCAGAKNILDLGLTLEFLETHCIPVISYRSQDFPAFFCRSSGFASPQRLDDDESVARSVELQWAIGYEGSVLITSPIDADEAVPFDDVEDAVKRAIGEAESAGLRGNALTKRLMRAVDAATQGRSSTANASVLINTAEVAGRLAAARARASRAGPMWFIEEGGPT